MHDDLLDAVEWAVKKGIADPSKVAIIGGSYGGYATLVGPDLHARRVRLRRRHRRPVEPQDAAGVDPALLGGVLRERSPRASATRARRRAGSCCTSARRSFTPAAIKKPLLIGQGANDPRVKQAEADQIVAAMKAKDMPVTYVLYPGRGPRLRAAREPHRRSTPSPRRSSPAPGRPLRARRQGLQGRQARGARGRGARAGAGGGAAGAGVTRRPRRVAAPRTAGRDRSCLYSSLVLPRACPPGSIPSTRASGREHLLLSMRSIAGVAEAAPLPETTGLHRSALLAPNSHSAAAAPPGNLGATGGLPPCIGQLPSIARQHNGQPR